LAPTSQNNPPETRDILEAQLRECYGRVVYSHKTHEKCADILLARLSRIKLAQIILSALTTAGFVAAIFGSGLIGTVLGLIVSTVLLALNAYTKDYDLGEIAQKHKQAACDLWFVRESYLSLITDIRMKKRAMEPIEQDRDKLMTRLHSVYSGAPSTTYPAYRKAQEALQKYEDMTFTDKEIDAFLPTLLKRAAGDVPHRFTP
jgi:hypothetical protein